MQGIDISCYQRDFKIQKGSGYDFVILKVCEGRTLSDDKFNDFYKAATSCGMKVGAYVFSYADSEERARDEVRFALSLIKGRELPLGLHMDIESDNLLNLSNDVFKRVVSAFVNEVEKSGYLSGIYSSELTGWSKIRPSDFPNSISWVAKYSSIKPNFSCDLWQKTEKGLVPGYSKGVDVDEVMSEKIKSLVNSKEVTKTSTESTINAAVSQMEAWANDDSHGYDQQYRWGERGDFDCSAAVIQAWQNAGVPVKTKGATYTGNMRSVFLGCGFKDVTSLVNLTNGSGLQRGDVLLNYLNHTAMYCGNGQEVEASINEYGTTTGGRPGDQTGREFLIRPYRNYPWNCVLRYVGSGTSSAVVNKPSTVTVETKVKVEVPEIKIGSKGSAVAALQGVLKFNGYNVGLMGIDGDFGGATNAAVKNFQQKNGLIVDGVVGEKTWAALMK